MSAPLTTSRAFSASFSAAFAARLSGGGIGAPGQWAGPLRRGSVEYWFERSPPNRPGDQADDHGAEHRGSDGRHPSNRGRADHCVGQADDGWCRRAGTDGRADQRLLERRRDRHHIPGHHGRGGERCDAATREAVPQRRPAALQAALDGPLARFQAACGLSPVQAGQVAEQDWLAVLGRKSRDFLVEDQCFLPRRRDGRGVRPRPRERRPGRMIGSGRCVPGRGPKSAGRRRAASWRRTPDAERPRPVAPGRGMWPERHPRRRDESAASRRHRPRIHGPCRRTSSTNAAGSAVAANRSSRLPSVPASVGQAGDATDGAEQAAKLARGHDQSLRVVVRSPC